MLIKTKNNRMKLLGLNLFGKKEDKSPAVRNADLNDDSFFSDTMAIASNFGISVTSKNSDSVFAVFGCARVRSESLGMLPIICYKRGKDGSRERDDTPKFTRLFERANRWQSWQSFCETMTWHLDMRGNAYAEILRDNGGRPVELIILNPDCVRPEVDKQGELYYRFTPSQSGERILAPEDVFHLKINSKNGILGVSPLSDQANLIEASEAQESFLAALFRNGTSLSGILKHPGKFKDENVQNRVLDSWRKAYSGSRNAGKVAILEEGMTWEKISMTAVDAQFAQLELQTMQKIAGVMRVPGHKIGDLTHAKYANIETQNIDFVTDTLLPYAKRWQDEISYKLMTEKEKQSYFVEFLFYELLKGDSKARNEVLQLQRQNGIISANEWRRIENMNPLGEEGNLRIVPSNFQSLEMLKNATTSPNPAIKQLTETQPKTEQEEQEIIQKFFLEALQERINLFLTKYQNLLIKSFKIKDETEKNTYLSELKLKSTSDIKPVVENFAKIYSRNVKSELIDSFINSLLHLDEKSAEEQKDFCRNKCKEFIEGM